MRKLIVVVSFALLFFCDKLIAQNTQATDDINCLEALASFIPLNNGLENSPSDVSCDKAKVNWVQDNQLSNCTILNDPSITNLEYGDSYDTNSKDFHCYYVETVICDTTSCANCDEKTVFELMLASLNRVAPTEESGDVSNCSYTNVSIPCSSLQGRPFNPIITTVHPNEKATINYTIKYYVKPDPQNTLQGASGWKEHLLHPGKVQRKIISYNGKVIVTTYGIGSGRNKDANINYAKRVWGAVDNRLKNAFECKQPTASTLFLFDLSGSMNERGRSGQAKLQEAKLAADATLTSIANDNAAGGSNEVCIMGFKGSCSSPISKNTGFKSDLTSIRTDVNSLAANGGTPLVEAIEIAECELIKQLNLKGQDVGKLIVLSDGQAGCQKVRPDETYIYGQSGKLTKNILANPTCGSDILAMRQAGNGAKYYTIGFNIRPGSGAERDLQYLAQASGGKYLNVQSRNQLEKALKKFNRTYIPKPDPALDNLPATATGQFKQGITEIMAESFFTALATCELFVQSHPKDCHGVYNLALMQEANDLFLDAVKSYETYLSLCPTASDKEYVEKQIKRLEEEQRQFILFQKQVIISDLEYLKAYYQSLFNTRNEVLAKEFKGFIKEKGNFYANLPKILNMKNEQWLIDASKDLSRGFKRTAKSVDDPDFDRMAVSLLTFPIEILEGIVEELK